MKVKQITIIGYGFVGQAVHSIINENKLCEVFIHDPYKKLYDQNFKTSDIIFLCLPTPFNKELDVSLIVEYLDSLKDSYYKGLVVIKSTVIYSKISKYFEYLNIVINPEFLNQNTSFHDAKTQNTILIGGDYNNSKKLMDLYTNNSILEDIQFELCSAKEASEFKYIRNIYGAYKVLFWEFVQNTTGNSRKMAELYHKMPYQSEMSQVSMDGYRGFGGACFPKDVAAFNQFYADSLTDFMIEYNENLQNK